MSFGGSVQGMITTLKNNTLKKNKRNSFDGLGEPPTGLYTKGKTKKEFSPEQIAAAKAAFAAKQKKHQQRTYWAIAITIVASALVVYGLTSLYMTLFA